MVFWGNWHHKMNEEKLFLGLDTSNYTTSVSVVNEKDDILEDQRIQLTVKPGEKGLRQSEALYQHWNHLPILLEPILKTYSARFSGVCVSEKPRPFEKSYMPVFKAGLSVAKIVSASLSIPMFCTTHQEGHFKAGSFANNIAKNRPLIAVHLSGGTLELVVITDKCFKLVGGTKDISYGQLLDRTGALLGLSFPSGPALDALANTYDLRVNKNPLRPVFTESTWVNLSGTETQLKAIADQYTKQELAVFLFDRIAESFLKITEAAKKKYAIDQVLVTGGVAASIFLRKRCEYSGYFFALTNLCTDNAVGVALLKGKPFCL